MRIRRTLASVACIAATGCLASKSDIKLLQDELRSTRAMIAQSDTVTIRVDQSRRSQIDALALSIQRTADSVRVLSNRLSSFQTRTTNDLDRIANQLIQVQAQLGATTRSLQEARAQLEQSREQPPPAAGDTTNRGPSPTTLFVEGRKQLEAGSYRTARNIFDQLLTTYPNFDQASLAMLYIGRSYDDERNTAAADSVYQRIVTTYPRSPEAPTALYKRAQLLWNAGKRKEAQPLLQRIIRDYPNSEVVDQARDLLGRIRS